LSSGSNNCVQPSNVTGNAATATALASAPTQCTSPLFATGIAASGNANCVGSQTANRFYAAPNGSAGNPSWRAIVGADIPTLNQSTTGNAATATALASTPTQCSGSQFSTGIAATGNANCAQPAFSNLSGTATTAQLPVALANQTSVNGTTIPASATLSKVIFEGTKALSTSLLTAGSCNTDTVSASGTLTTDVVGATPNADLTGVTGYAPSGPILTVYPPYVSVAGTITIKVCNNAGNVVSITPGAVMLNLQVLR